MNCFSYYLCHICEYFAGRTMAICLDRMVFYRPPEAAVPNPVSHGLLVRNGNASTTIPGPPLRLPLPHNTHDAQNSLPESQGIILS